MRKIIFILLLSLLPVHNAHAIGGRKIKGIRLDPGYLYDTIYQKQGLNDTQKLSTFVVDQVVRHGFNTIYFLAYSPDSGAFYPTNYSMTIVEGDFGQNDFLGSLLKAAHLKNISVVAWLPVNNFKQVWLKQKEWREKNKWGMDYRPTADIYLLSPWHNSFRSWYQGFLEDLCTRYPDLDGLEAGEGIVDFNWDGASDYNKYAKARYAASYPKGRIGDENWLRFRAQGLTDLHRLLGLVAHNHKKEAHVVQTWSTVDNERGDLMSSEDIMLGSGFDFDGILNLDIADGRPDYMVGEFMWQQWQDTYENSAFNIAWTEKAANDFVAKVGQRSTPVIHIELSPFGRSKITNLDFLKTLQHAILPGNIGVDIYDFHQIYSRGLFKTPEPLISPKKQLAGYQ